MDLSFDDIMDVIGTFSFALAGSLAGMQKRLDPFGVLIIALRYNWSLPAWYGASEKK